MLSNSDIPNDISQKIEQVLGQLRTVSDSILQEQKLNLTIMPMFRNHNRFLMIDRDALHVVYTNEGVTSGMVSSTDRDFRSKGTFSQREIAEACGRDLGFKDIHYFSFPANIINQTEEERKPLVERVVHQYIAERIRPLLRLEALGLSEALTYLQNARARFETKTAQGYADCKSNCRNAIVSCMKTLTGQENLREGAKILGKKDLIGEREEELVIAFGDLFAKLHNVASKKGPHPPLSPDEEDAALVLGMTESILNYLATKALNKNQA